MLLSLSQLATHLEGEICPDGARVWPVQSQCWLVTVIDCGREGKVCIKGSKTDYLFLTQGGWDYLDSLAKDKIKIGADDITLVLQEVIGFYEVRGNICM